MITDVQTSSSMADGVDIAAIAAKLTAPQRRAVLAGGPKYGGGYWQLLNALMAKGIMTSAARRYVLSPLGNQVRAYLQEAQA